ncbi:MAG: outer membrane lipid asymmetry maintenance protein MlaD [Thermodesulfobacteria bacterium]|nr:outer membrane lipid asymmetry maintenance protein MlaD [Thermodesulfobacteriota bacterium]
MKKYSQETIVGIFVLIGLLCVAYLTIKLGKMELLGGNYYHISAAFDNVGGLKPDSSVQMAGVEIGRVQSIKLDTENYMAVVRMKIKKNVPIQEDAIASIKTSGLIGDKYVSIQPGGSDELLGEGGVITDTESAVDIESLISKYVFGSVKK